MTSTELALFLADQHETLAANLRTVARGGPDALNAVLASERPIGAPGTTRLQPVAPNASVPGRERPWKHVGSLDDQTHVWPEGIARFERSEIYETVDARGTVRIGIGWADENAIKLGKHPRAYLMTFLVVGLSKRDPIVLFTATDDHEETGDWVAVIKGKGARGTEMFAAGDDLPAAYAGMRIDGYRDRVDQPYRPNRLAVVAVGGDVDTILDHALIQLRMRVK